MGNKQAMVAMHGSKRAIVVIHWQHGKIWATNRQMWQYAANKSVILTLYEDQHRQWWKYNGNKWAIITIWWQRWWWQYVAYKQTCGTVTKKNATCNLDNTKAKKWKQLNYKGNKRAMVLILGQQTGNGDIIWTIVAIHWQQTGNGGNTWQQSGNGGNILAMWQNMENTRAMVALHGQQWQ